MSRVQRCWQAGGGCILLGLLVVARCLQPNPTGLGTHQALGLPPCSALTWFNIPCPTCGMTTSWAHFVRGDWVRSWMCNPGGTCLAVLALVASIWALQNAISGRYRPWLSLRASTVLAVGITVLTLVHWLGRIF